MMQEARELVRRLLEPTGDEIADFHTARDAATTITTLLDKLEREREGFGAMVVACAQAGLGIRDKTQEEIAAGGDDQCRVKIINRPLEAAEARADKLAAALEPFAAAAEDIEETTPDRAEMWEDPASMNVSAGDFRAARSALAEMGVANG